MNLSEAELISESSLLFLFSSKRTVLIATSRAKDQITAHCRNDDTDPEEHKQIE